MFPFVGSGKGFRIAVAAGTALISAEAGFCTGRLLRRYHRILMARSGIIGSPSFGSRAGLTIADIIAVLGASVGYSFPKRPIVGVFRRLSAVQLGQFFSLRVIAAGAETDRRAGAGGRRFLCYRPFTKSMAQRSDLGVLVAAAAQLTGVRSISSCRTGGLGDLGSVVMGQLGRVGV